jgi:FixJ family two-component response regulator
VDVRDALASLSPEDRSLAKAIAEGKPIRQIATEQGCSWCKVQRQVDRIRRSFEARGLDGWLTSKE